MIPYIVPLLWQIAIEATEEDRADYEAMQWGGKTTGVLLRAGRR